MHGRPYHHGDLPRLLVDVTQRLVEEHGVESVTIARVARECGVSVAAPYRHFDDKRALLGAVAARGFDALREAVGGAEGGDERERLVSAGVAYVDFAVAHPALFQLMFDVTERERQHEAGLAALAGLRTLVEPLRPAIPVETAVRSTWALAHGLALLRIGGMLTFARDDTEQRLREELGVVLSGIAPAR